MLVGTLNTVFKEKKHLIGQVCTPVLLSCTRPLVLPPENEKRKKPFFPDLGGDPP